MEGTGVHYLAYNNVKKKLAQNAIEYEKVAADLNEAIKMGDLRENAEYDAAKERLAKVTSERDLLQPYLSLPQVKDSDNLDIFGEGCVVELKVYSLTNSPLDVNSKEFDELILKEPVFNGKIMLGGTLPIHDILNDAALSTETPIGKALIGKQSGRFSIQVPGGFSNLVAKKIKSTDVNEEDIFCVFTG